jgi:hypothetical protein
MSYEFHDTDDVSYSDDPVKVGLGGSGLALSC